MYVSFKSISSCDRLAVTPDGVLSIKVASYDGAQFRVKQRVDVSFMTKGDADSLTFLCPSSR